MQQTCSAELPQILIDRSECGRIIVAVAGPPGAGKTTFTRDLAGLIDQRRAGLCGVLPMDGFHYDDLYLEQMGWKARKGAPHTFDVGGLEHILNRLKTNREQQIFVPVFDRSIEIARAGARAIPDSAKIILVEGNYLLLDEPPWSALANYFNVTVMLKADRASLDQRLRDRWTGYGLSEKELKKKLTENDLPNVETTLDKSRSADYFVVTDKAGSSR